VNDQEEIDTILRAVTFTRLGEGGSPKETDSDAIMDSKALT
jgi:hypothetical protein